MKKKTILTLTALLLFCAANIFAFSSKDSGAKIERILNNTEALSENETIPYIDPFYYPQEYWCRYGTGKICLPIDDENEYCNFGWEEDCLEYT